MNVTKYNLDWQVVRMEARSIKDVASKTAYITQFFMSNKSEQNRERILNWACMTKLGYGASTEAVKPLERLEINMAWWIGKVSYEVENHHNFEDYSLDVLERLYKDLSRRKWNFQFKQAPKEHVEFMHKLKEAINGKEKI